MSHWLQYCNLSPECVFKWYLRSHFIKKALAHSLHWYGFSPVCILKCPIRLIFFKKHCHIHCICMVLLLYEFTYASQKYTVWYDIHFENCLRVKWYATCITVQISYVNFLTKIRRWDFLCIISISVKYIHCKNIYFLNRVHLLKIKLFIIPQ